ncbi:hypothetical protein LTR37_008023 [Vermiconidia calcicola]|uniref:Uncharacterized protein n=1 Tax=Vermiconidia calcicola TaxID=1690605 RepID=A0ACC3NDM3_9PEZI|nr:hypothetical protein LTR37_008023 [Vermiconidia calcicola]
MDNATLSVSDEASFPLFRLPAEIRNMIYKEVLVQKTGVYIAAIGVPEPPLLRVSRLLRKETITIYYGCNIFHIPTTNYDSSVFLHWTTMRRRLRKEHKIRTQADGVGGRMLPHWGNLVLWLRGYYDGSIAWKSKFPCDISRNESADIMVVGGMFHIVHQMKDKSWEKVLEVLEQQHMILVKIDARWA